MSSSPRDPGLCLGRPKRKPAAWRPKQRKAKPQTQPSVSISARGDLPNHTQGAHCRRTRSFLTKERDIQKLFSEDMASFFALVHRQAANAAFRSRMEFEAARIPYTGRVFRFNDVGLRRYYLNSAKGDMFRRTVKNIYLDAADDRHYGYWNVYFGSEWRSRDFPLFDKSRFPNPERLAVETYGFVGRNACKQLAAKCTMKALTAKARIQRA